jgi:hypothetical protein
MHTETFTLRFPMGKWGSGVEALESDCPPEFSLKTASRGASRWMGPSSAFGLGVKNYADKIRVIKYLPAVVRQFQASTLFFDHS